jgi:hypothetical protein
MALVLAGEDKTQARRLQRLAAAGQLRRIYAGIYTDDLVQTLESIARREIFNSGILREPLLCHWDWNQNSSDSTRQ